MGYFIHGLRPRRIDIVLKTGDGVTVDRPCDVERCPCLGCDYSHNKHHNIEIDAKGYKEMYGNMEAPGRFWGSRRTIL
jgi:hypothetical protein